jgi:hypothetical protein
MSRNESDLLKAKRALYAVLLHLDPEETTNAELNIMYALMKDPHIQKFLDDVFEKERKK